MYKIYLYKSIHHYLFAYCALAFGKEAQWTAQNHVSYFTLLLTRMIRVCVTSVESTWSYFPGGLVRGGNRRM